MNDYVKAWQCIGCGRIEALQPCIGICQNRKVEFVYADEHEQTLAELAAARRKANALEALVRQLACTSPHKDRWENSYRVMQEHARALLASTENGPRETALTELTK
jgi:hypothetical protein